MALATRRVVTGTDSQGRSGVLFDSPAGTLPGAPGDGRSAAPGFILWETEETPARNGGAAERSGPFDLAHLSTHGSACVLYEFTPDSAPPLMHATDSLDYVVVLSGRMRLTLETGTVDLDPGDLVINRGVLHGWNALGGRPAQILGVSVKADPVGPGARVIA